MQTRSTPWRTAYEQGLSLKALPRVIVEWNHNRFAPIANAFAESEYENKMHPITSIVGPQRPTTGVPKARVGESKAAGRNSLHAFRTTSVPSSEKYPEREIHYDGTTEHINEPTFRYWVSKTSSNGTYGAALGGYTIENADAWVLYGNSRRTNKIVIGLETTWTRPTLYRVHVTFDGYNWTQIASNPPINAKGQIVLYRQTNGSWGPDVEYRADSNIRGVRLDVQSLDRAYAHLSVIEISARLEKDISSDVINASVRKTMSEPNVVSPIGLVSANTCSIQLDNSEARYDAENATGPYYGLLDKNAEVRLFMGVDTTPWGGTWEYMPQGVFYVDTPWQLDTENASVTIECSDYAKFFQSEKTRRRLFAKTSAQKIIVELAKMAGFNNFDIDVKNTDYLIDYIWFDDDVTVWEAMSQVCRAVQCAVYFDELGRLKFVGRNDLYNKLAGPVEYPLTAVNDGPMLANIVELNHEYDDQANKVSVTYTPTAPNERSIPRVVTLNSGIFRRRPRSFITYDKTPINSVLWKPEDTVALQAARLDKPMTAGDNKIQLETKYAKTWPWSGMMNIEGEILSWDGKTYRWFDANGTVRYSTVKTIDEQKAIDEKSNPYQGYKNEYTGELVNVRRGLRGTKAQPHYLDIDGWNFRHKRLNTTVVDGRPYVKHDDSMLQLWGPDENTYENYLMAIRGTSINTFTVYGTRLRFAHVQTKHETCGMFFHLQDDDKSGYYIEFNSTDMSTRVLKGSVNNIRCYRMYADGRRRHLPNNLNTTADDKNFIQGFNRNIVAGQWVDVDVTYNPGNREIKVFINGSFLVSFIDPHPNPLVRGRWGMFTRGHTVGLFEYFYTALRPEPPDIEKSSHFSQVEGGYVSGYSQREVYISGGHVQWFMDEFGPICHEVREFNVEFDKVPALSSYVYITNTWDAFVLEHTHTPFGARFLVANAGRDTAILNGDDPTVIQGNVVPQQMIVYGQLVLQEEEKTLVVQNEPAIRKRGVVDLSYESSWIQTDGQARAIGDFITTRFGEPTDNMTATVFIDPAVQVGDYVTLNWPTRSLTPSTHKYHVTGVNLSYDNGIQGSLSLRRAR